MAQIATGSAEIPLLEEYSSRAARILQKEGEPPRMRLNREYFRVTDSGSSVSG
jgi:hypothetical protein